MAARAEKQSDVCPECSSPDAFWHCDDRCCTPTHVVTCRACKTPYLTARRPGE